MTVDNLIPLLAIMAGIVLGLQVMNIVSRQVINAFKGYGVESTSKPVEIDLTPMFDSIDRLLGTDPPAANREVRSTQAIIRYIWERTPDCHHFRINTAGVVSNITPRFESVAVETNGAMHFKLRLCKVGTFGFKNVLPEGVQLEALIAPDVVNAMSAALMREVTVKMSEDGQYLLLHVSSELKLKKNVLSTEEHDANAGYVLGDDGELVPVALFEEEAQHNG